MGLSQLEARNRELDDQIAAVDMSRQIQVKESYLGAATMQETYPDYLTARDISRETGWGRDATGPWISRPDDYVNGHYRPFYESEQDHQEMRGIGRYLAGTDELANCVLTNLSNYIVGAGSEVTVTAKGNEGKPYEAALQTFLDEFLDLNDFTDEGETDAFLRAVIDGDRLMWLQDNGVHAPRVRFIGGEHIRRPPDPREIEDYVDKVGLDWTYGVATDQNDPTKIHGFFVDWYGQGGTNWDFIPVEHSVFIKRNVPRECKRGVSDFYIPYRNMEQGQKLFGNVVIGGSIQASIAGIKKAANGTQETDINSALSGRLRTAGTAYNPDGTSASVNYERFKGGNMLTIANMDYMYGPMGTPQGPTFIDIYQAVARLVGTRWCMPEYMISGDASNANYASTLVAEHPFVKTAVSEQSTLGRHLKRLLWRAVSMAAGHGRFQGITGEQLYALLTLEVEYQSPESHNPIEVEQVFDLQQSAGVLSPKTRAAKSNLDFEKETKDGAGALEDAPLSPQESVKLSAFAGAMETATTINEARSLLRGI